MSRKIIFALFVLHFNLMANESNGVQETPDSTVVNTEPAVVNTEPTVVNTEPAIVNTDSAVVNTEPAIVNTDSAVVNTEPAVVDTKLNNEQGVFDTLIVIEGSDSEVDSVVSHDDTSMQPSGTCLEPCPRTAWSYDKEGIVLSGEFLWWRIDEACLDYAMTKDVPVYQLLSTASPADGLVGDMHKGRYEWGPGFRVGLAYQFINTPWSLQAEYTRYTRQNKNHARIPDAKGDQTFTGGTVPISTLNNTTSGFLADVPIRASSKLDFKYNVVDLNFVRHLFSTSSFIFNPFFGIQGGFISQDWHLQYNSRAGTIGDTQTHKTKWEFNGGGIDIGINMDWYWGAGFSFYATAKVAALYGEYRHSHHTETTPAFVKLYQDVSEREDRTAQMTQLGAGVEWSYAFTKQAICLFTGWEFNTWYNLAESYRFAEATTGGGANGNTFPTYTKPMAVDKSDIHLQGLTVGAKWLF